MSAGGPGGSEWDDDAAQEFWADDAVADEVEVVEAVVEDDEWEDEVADDAVDEVDPVAVESGDEWVEADGDDEWLDADAWVEADPDETAVADAAGGGPPGPEAPAAASGGGGRPRRNRAVRVVVLAVLLAMLAGGIALGRRTPEVTPVRVATAGLDGPEVPPADAVSTAWYCSAGTSSRGGSEDETIYVANLSPEPITADVTVDPGSGQDPQTARLQIDGYERASLPVSEVLAVDSPGVVVEVAGGAAVVEHEIRNAGDLAMSPCSHEPSATWYFAGGGTPKGTTQALELFNPFGDDAIVDIAFLTEGGVQEPQAMQGLVVGRRSKVLVPVTDLVARQERVATVIRTRTGRVVAEQIRTFDGTDGRSGLTLSLGAAAPRQQWTLPVAQAQTGATGVVAIANFGLTPASVEVAVLLSGEGVLVPETVDVPSRSVVHFDPSPRIPVGTTYSLVVTAQGDKAVVAEAVVTAPNGAATTIGASTAARRWAFAGSPDRASSAVVAVNRGAVPLTVELRAYTAGDPNSPHSAPAIAVAPGTSVRFDLDEWGIDPDQVLVVAADGPIVVGRETYAGGVSLALGIPFAD